MTRLLGSGEGRGKRGGVGWAGDDDGVDSGSNKLAVVRPTMRVTMRAESACV